MKKIIFLLLLLSCAMRAFSLSDSEAKKILHAYREKCDLVAHKPVVLKMADTLYMMADRMNKKNYKITAQCLKMTYYYGKENCRDSVSKYCETIKGLCHGHDDDIFYYFACSECISDYIVRREFHLAMNEIRSLRAESEANHNMMGVATCYAMMTHLFSVKCNYEMAAKYMKKSIDLTLKYKLENYNISADYCSLSFFLLQDGHADQAYPYIKLCYKTARLEGHTVQAVAAEAFYWYVKKNIAELRRLQRVAAKFKSAEAVLAVSAANYYYNMLAGNYAAAEPFLKGLYENNFFLKDEYLRRDAELVSHIPGAGTKAIEAWQTYMTYKDSLMRSDSKIELSEFATLMDMTQLKIENQKMLFREKNARFHQALGLLGLSILFILILVFFFVKIMKLNKKLNHSHRSLAKKNVDLTRIQKVLVHERDYLEQIHNMEAAFIRSIGYQVNSPINSVIGFGQLLQEVKDDPEEVMNCAKSIELTGNTLHKAMDEMTTMFSLRLDKSKAELSPISVNEVCRISIAQVIDAEKPSVNIFQNVLKPEFTIVSDNVSISLILEHIIGNAVKHGGNTDITVDVQLTDDNQYVDVSVSDHGPGIPQEQQERIFQGFVKLDYFTPGMGLGLSISRFTAERINATLTIDSSYTDGCRCVLRLPAKDYKVLDDK